MASFYWETLKIVYTYKHNVEHQLFKTHTQHYPYARESKQVFKLDLKASSYGEALMFRGRQFQSFGEDYRESSITF